MLRILKIVVCCGFLVAASAQTTTSLFGVVEDPSGAAVIGAEVVVSNPATGLSRTVVTTDSGYSFSNLPLGNYQVRARHAGFQDRVVDVVLRSGVPQQANIALQVRSDDQRLEVSYSNVFAQIEPELTGTRNQLNAKVIEQLPVSVSSRGLESVLISFPGFAQNANGAIHPRGAHNQMTYVIDGMPISDQLTGSFANPVDASIADTIELWTGNIPAEFGGKVSGVAQITTHSGLGRGRPFGGSLQARAGTFGTAASDLEFGGERGKLGYFSAFTFFKSNRFLDQVSLDNLHNGGNSQRGFTRLDYKPSDRDRLHLNVSLGRSSFELANLRSQQAAGQDQRQNLRDLSVSLNWNRVLSPRTAVDLMTSYRTAITQLTPSAGDTPVTASQARHLSTLLLGGRVSHVRSRHNIRAGVDYQHFPVSEDFRFGITHPDFNDPASADFIPTLLAHDLTRGGMLFSFRKRDAGNQYSAFVQDNVTLGRFALSLGLRYDVYRFLVNGNQVQPRVGVSYHLRETGTVLRASYNRNYQTPPNENLLLSNSQESTVLVPANVRDTLGGALIRIRPERQDVLEGGVQQSLGRYLSLNAAYYHKRGRDLSDNDNFLNTGIIFPTALKASRINGAEGKITLLPVGGLSGWVGFTHYHAVVTPPFTGGLFIGSGAINALSSGPFVIDHDQKLGVHGMALYQVNRNLWTSTSIRYDSGLVSNPSDPLEVAADPDYADQLPYVDLLSDPARVRPRTVVDWAIGYGHTVNDRKRWEVQAQVMNLFDQTALFNFQSIFVGTRVIAPRTFGAKLRWYW